MDANISGLYNPATKFTPGKDFKISDLILPDNGLDVLNLIFTIAGLYFFVALIIAGWTFMTSSGDSKKAATASGQITNAFTGLIMVFSAFLIVRIITSILGLNNLF